MGISPLLLIAGGYMNYSHILWDFNGTLLDDVGIGVECINLLLASRGLPPLRSRAEYQRHFRFPIEDYYRSVGFDFSRDPYDILAHEWVALYRERENSAPLFEGAEEILTYVQSRQIPQILFSATQREMLLQQVEALGIARYFDEILGSDNIYAAGKVAVGRAWMEAVAPERALLIGDSLHDAEAAREMGIECILVARGHQSRETLRAAGVPVLEDFSQVRELLEDASCEKPEGFR